MSGFGARIRAGAVMAVVLTLSSGALYSPAIASEPVWTHASTLSGEPRYGRDFKHFDYVNPQAPKAGTVRLSTNGGFDTFNPILPKGNVAPGLSLIFETLTTSSLDELDTSATYGLIASETRAPDDFSWVEFRINPKARWHDGKAITAQDIIWSFEKAIEISPRQRFYFQSVEKAEIMSEDVVRFTFDAPGNREMPHIMGQLMVLPQHWWEGVDAKGRQRDIARGTLEPPLGSGPYKIGDFQANRQITYERAPDYWGAELPVNVGKNNFNTIRYISFMDHAIELEAFKGDQYDFRAEPSASTWAKRYNFPAVREGKVILEEFPDHARGVMQAYAPNLRRKKFQDPRVRRALNFAYDFETGNEIVSAGLLKRIGSYFAGTELAASGLPEGRELEILESVRGSVPEEVFTTPFENPVGGNPQNVRKNLRRAVQLFQEAGYKLDGRKMVDAETGEQFSIEFLYYDKSAERGLLPYIKSLETIGVKATPRIVDLPQYIARIRSHDFDMATLAWGQSLSPGNEQRNYWGTEAADLEQSQNYMGIKNPAVDQLIERIIYAKDREELVAATRALDRVLLWNHYVVPQFYSDVDRTARWNRFSHPEKMPKFSYGFPEIWWWDAEKAAETEAR